MFRESLKAAAAFLLASVFLSSASPAADNRSKNARERRSSPLVIPVKLDEQGHIVLRESFHDGCEPYEASVTKIDGVDEVDVTYRQDLEGKTIERILAREVVLISDREGKKLDGSAVATRLKDWTPVFINYYEPSVHNIVRGLPDDQELTPTLEMMRLARSDALFLHAPIPVVGAIVLSEVKTSVPAAPESWHESAMWPVTRGAETVQREWCYSVWKPVYETRTQQSDTVDRKKGMQYQVRRSVLEIRVKTLVRTIDWANVRRVDGKPYGDAAAAGSAPKEIPGIISADGKPIDPFYLRAFRDDVVVFARLLGELPSTPQPKAAPAPPGTTKGTQEQPQDPSIWVPPGRTPVPRSEGSRTGVLPVPVASSRETPALATPCSSASQEVPRCESTSPEDKDRFVRACMKFLE